MRISSNTLFQNASNQLSELQSKVNQTTQQISTGKKNLKPSDDPASAARLLQLQQALASNDQLTENRQRMRENLSEVDSVLASMNETLQSVQEQIVTAGNGSLSDDQRQQVATVLQAHFQTLVSQINSKDSSGRYLFSGTQNRMQASANQNGTVTYQADLQQNGVQVDPDPAMKMTASFTPQALFGVAGNDIFAQINQAVTALNSPTPDHAAIVQSFANLNSSYKTTFDNVVHAQTVVGLRFQQLDSLDNAAADQRLQLSKTQSDLQDVDYNQAVSELSQQQFLLQLAQKAYAKTSQLSLFDFIN